MPTDLPVREAPQSRAKRVVDGFFGLVYFTLFVAICYPFWCIFWNLLWGTLAMARYYCHYWQTLVG